MTRQNYITILLIVSFFISYWWLVYSPVETGEEKEFTIRKGDNLSQVARGLAREDLIRNRFFFMLHIFLKGEARKIKAGQYLVSSDQSAADIADMIVEGAVIKNSITIIEGWGLDDIAAYLEEKNISGRAEFFGVVGYPDKGYDDSYHNSASPLFTQRFEFIQTKPSSHLEGYLFPDTYAIKSSAKIEDIVLKMLSNFESKITPAMEDAIKTQGKTLFEIVNMASLLEKEVNSLEDKKIVSGVLWKRIKQGMPLQVDATIIYLTGKKTTRIPLTDTQIDSPYNTYKYKGLPPAPIANPGLDSIVAAIYPEDSSFWYYLSTPEGKTIFSKTLEEHNTAKNKYLSN